MPKFPESVPAAASSAAVEPHKLLRVLGVWGATAIVVGIMIGSAIFIVPAEITREVGSPRAGLAVWLVAGVLSLFGALSFAELAAMMPEAGGQYIYLREAYGPLVSFLCGWMFFLIQQSGGIATLAVGLTRYLSHFFPFTLWQQRAAAAAVIILLTAINYRGVREGSWVQSVLTSMSVGIAVGLIALGYALVHGPAGGAPSLPAPGGVRFLGAFGVAMVAALWAYEGWNNVTFAAGEVKRPERNLPRALFVGTGAVVLIYMGLNMVFYHVLTLPEIAQSPRVAADAASRILGPWGAQLVALAIIIAVFGSTNGSILAGARVYYAMAEDGLFFRWCARVHPRFRTPHLALVVQAVWSVLLVMLAGYEELFTYTVFAAWIFYALTAVAVIVLRRKLPDAPRPYRVFAYPWVPVVFVIAAAWLVGNTLVEKPVEAGWGCVLIALGVPVYLIWRRSLRRSAAA
ncbi:MAG TPA: amino acid permease [Terriglobia bacterium]|nr:amino acid permease [Terriglobia bacterium]